MPTEDGWEPSPRIEPDSPLLVWKQVPGTDVTIQVRDDDAGTLMLAYAADYHATVEPLRDADTACYTPENSVSTSNHLNATAMDFDWDSHEFQVRGTLTGDKLVNLRKLLAFYDPWMFWAGDWDDPVDEMHHQMNYGSYELAQQGKLAAWVKANIRPDGFSTYKHDALPGMTDSPAPSAPAPIATSPSPRDASIKALYDAVPVIDMDRAAALVDPVMAGLAAAQCINVERVAMWLAQIGEESGGFVYTEEIAKDGPYAPYIGRTWIQITWESNYAAFGQWAHDQGLIDDPDYFVNNPTALADLKWAGLGAAWYWTVARPTINSLCDQGDIVGVTQLINGGQNGIDDRRARYNQAIALGDELLALIAATTPTSSGGTITLADVSQDDWNQLVADVKEIRSQLNGDGTWPQTGSDPDAIKRLEALAASGKPMSLLDTVAWLKHHASTHQAPTP
jgi:putative chitinase